MKEVFIVLELDDQSSFDPHDDVHLDELAEDLLQVRNKMCGAVTYSRFEALAEDERRA